ncbi:MAG: hypothetical protein KA173_11840 [Rhodoferax sp.]|nr:hypothetical protein [Rhodoferax sp.]MBP7491267.1 hypothetical protein [Rhodoferax sp.]
MALLLALQACSPALNWREVRVDAAPLLALFPCRPDQGVQSVALGERVVKMTMMGCEAGGAMFTLAQVSRSGDDAALMAWWRTGTLASMQGVQTREAPFLLKKVSASPEPQQIRASGKRPDGSPVVLRAAWFAVGGAVYQVAVYADSDNEAVVQTYFEGLRVD